MSRSTSFELRFGNRYVSNSSTLNEAYVCATWSPLSMINATNIAGKARIPMQAFILTMMWRSGRRTLSTHTQLHTATAPERTPIALTIAQYPLLSAAKIITAEAGSQQQWRASAINLNIHTPWNFASVLFTRRFVLATSLTIHNIPRLLFFFFFYLFTLFTPNLHFTINLAGFLALSANHNQRSVTSALSTQPPTQLAPLLRLPPNNKQTLAPTKPLSRTAPTRRPSKFFSRHRGTGLSHWTSRLVEPY